jgi:hypothetical protein
MKWLQDASKSKLNPQIPRKPEEDKKPVTDWQPVTFQNDCDPYANAISERVNGILKQEFLLEDYHVDIETMKLLVEDALCIYNTKRPHWSCYMKTLEQMHYQNEVKIRTYKKTKIVVGPARQLSHKLLIFLSYKTVTII